MYQEDVHVPLMFWFPRGIGRRCARRAVGGHVDLAPTIAELAGLPPPPDWQGRSLFDPARAPRAPTSTWPEIDSSWASAKANWKYILDLREGVEQLYDLDAGSHRAAESRAQHPERCARLRQRLAAWTEANRRQYERANIG